MAKPEQGISIPNNGRIGPGWIHLAGKATHSEDGVRPLSVTCQSTVSLEPRASGYFRFPHQVPPLCPLMLSPKLLSELLSLGQAQDMEPDGQPELDPQQARELTRDH